MVDGPPYGDGVEPERWAACASHLLHGFLRVVVEGHPFEQLVDEISELSTLDRGRALGFRRPVDEVGDARGSEVLVRGRLEQSMQRVDNAADRLLRGSRVLLRDHATRLEGAAARLGSLNPREVLRRGYSVCVDPASGRLVAREADALEAGRVHIMFHDGAVAAAVEGAIRAQGGAA